MGITLMVTDISCR